MSFKSNQIKKMTRNHSSPFPACFRPPTTKLALESPHAPPPTTATTTTTPNLTTNLYQTQLGLFSITWSRSFLARTLHIHLHPTSSSTPSTSSPSFQLTLKPFAFWSKRGSKTVDNNNDKNDVLLDIMWDFSNARFGAGPEPESGYYIAVVSNDTTVLLVGDMDKVYNTRVKHRKLAKQADQNMVVRREHVCGTRYYKTKTCIAGKTRDILIEVNKNIEDDPRLIIRFDNKRVIQVKHLKWKFRGSERFEIDGDQVQFSWDVCNWLFVDDSSGTDEGYALFTFRFEQEKKTISNEIRRSSTRGSSTERVLMWSQDSCGLSYERKKMKKKLLVKTSSSSSSSLSSASSCGSSSIMEWESVEENELKAPTGFSLLVYAWKN